MPGLYKWGCVSISGGMCILGGSGLFHVFTEGHQEFRSYRVRFANFFNRVYFDLGAMQEQLLLSGTRCHAEACTFVWHQRDLRLSGCAGPHRHMQRLVLLSVPRFTHVSPDAWEPSMQKLVFLSAQLLQCNPRVLRGCISALQQAVSI